MCFCETPNPRQSMKPCDVVRLIVVGMNRSGEGFNYCQFLIEMRRMVDTNCKGGDASGTDMVDEIKTEL